MEAGRGAYCNPIHDRAHGVHAHRDWGQSEQSCPLPQTRRRSEGKERTAGAAGRGNERERDILSVEERERERKGADIEERVSARKRSLQEERGEAARLFSPDQFYARTPELPHPGDLVLSFAQERTVIGTVC